MLLPFLNLAMTAPARHLAFRRAAVLHALAVAIILAAAFRAGTLQALGLAGQVLLVLGIVEGAAMIGWRLVQLPKSQALEFLLVSPVRPRRVFLGEALAGAGRFIAVQLAGLPPLVLGAMLGVGEWADLIAFGLLPLVWGLVTGFAITAWIYEPKPVRRVGELLAMAGVLLYLVIGLAAAENLGLWLQTLPPWLGQAVYDGIMTLNNFNPFGFVRQWFSSDRVPWLAVERLVILNGIAIVAIALLGTRAACRLHGHFHDRHYKPIDSSRAAQTALIGDAPLSWWAVRRVMEYSGRVNLYLAGGFCCAYAAFLTAGDAWPAWMGRMAFVLFESWGGPAMVATAMAIMAAVPAVYQFGLWDPTVQDRCRRLELLLLTDLESDDYWNAARAAAWRRGRGYLVVAGILIAACAAGERCTYLAAFAAAGGALVFWAFAFTVGFRGFASGHQTNGVASLLTLGAPLVLIGLWSFKLQTLAFLVPTSIVFLPLKTGITWTWLLSVLLWGGVTLRLARVGLARCDGDLRRWYDAHQGLQTAG